MCVKDVKIYFIGLKKTCLGVLERGDRDKDNEIGLKQGGRIEIETTVLHSRAAPSLKYSPDSNLIIRQVIVHRKHNNAVLTTFDDSYHSYCIPVMHSTFLQCLMPM